MPHNNKRNQHALDRLSDVDELLAEQNQMLQSLLQQHGVAELQSPHDYKATPYEYAPIPEQGDTLPLPAGVVSFDFDTGEVRVDTARNTPDVSDTLAEIRTFSDMNTSVQNADVQALRSLYLSVDVPCEVALGGGQHRFTLDPSQYYPLRSQGFKRFKIHTDYPVSVVGIASTRAEGFTTDSVQNHMQREGQLSSGTHDSYQSVGWWPNGLGDVLPSGTAASSFANEVINARAHNRHSFRIENNSGNGNAIDIKVQAADTAALNWYDIGLSSTGVADGDHVVYDTQERHNYYRVRVKNNTAGTTVSATGTITGGS